MPDIKRLYELIADIFDCQPDEITAQTDFVEDLYADSLDAVELAIMLEEEFGLSGLTQADFSQYHTVGDVIAFLEKNV